ncbi:MAG: hypothetical protein ABSD47_17555, partial [Candidatus Methylomirabilota bacterium]
STPSIVGVLERLGCGPATAEGRRLLAAIRTDGWRAYGSAAIHRNGTAGHHDLAEEDEGLFPSNVPMPEEMFADRLVAGFGDPPMVQGQIDIRTADMPRLGEWQEQLRYPSPDNHDLVAILPQ